MAAYAAAVTSLLQKPARMGDVVGVGVWAGKCDITNYNTTLVEITGITGKFQNMISVVGGVSDNGYMVVWVAASLSFKAYYPTIASDQTPTADIVAAAGSEVVNDVDVGVVEFVAVGLV